MFRIVKAGAAMPKKSASLRQHTIDLHSSFRNTGDVIAVSPGTAGVQYSFLTTESADAHASVGAAGVYGSSGLSVAQRISIRNGLWRGFSPRFTRLVADVRIEALFLHA